MQFNSSVVRYITSIISKRQLGRAISHSVLVEADMLIEIAVVTVDL